MSKWRNRKAAIDLLVIHCSATPNGQRVTVDEIDRWHAERGFHRAPQFRQRQNPQLAAIGYHFIIYPRGAVCTGRHLDETGAHARGHNLTSIGICLIGTDRFSLAQWQSLRANINGLRRQFPRARVVGHRDLSPDLDGDGVIEPDEWTKTCPGFDVAGWLAGDMAPLSDHLFEGDDDAA